MRQYIYLYEWNIQIKIMKYINHGYADLILIGLHITIDVIYKGEGTNKSYETQHNEKRVWNYTSVPKIKW